MRQYLQLVLLCLFTYSVQAQDLTIEPIPVEETFNVDLSNEVLDLELHATITNNTDEEMQLKWTRKVISKPDAWRTQVCDNNTCYIPQVSTNYDPDNGVNEPSVLAAGASFNLIFHVLPNQIEGTGEFHVEFSSISRPDSVMDTAVFIFDVIGTTSTFETSKLKLKAFPNPAQDYIRLSPNNIVDQLVIYNIVGRQVKTFDAINGEKYDIVDLPDGMYLISLLNNNTGIVKTIRMSKRSLRP